MKKFLLFIFLTMIAFAVNAQKFFYVETETSWEKQMKEKLVKSSQYVVESVLESDYIIKPEISMQ